MRRPLVLAAVGVAATGLLAACDKPVPKLTIQSGAVSTQVTPTKYEFDASHLRTLPPDIPEITAKPNGTVLIDVPRAVAGRGWTVTSLSLDGLKSIGTETVKSHHSFRVAANVNNLNPFLVSIHQLRDGKPDNSVWSFLVKVSQS
jgi:hypothetical protein